MNIFRLILSVLLIAASLPACGQESYSPPPDTSQEKNLQRVLSGLLREGKYQELDAKVNGLQLDYEQGKLSDVSLLHVFRAFYGTDPSLESKYNTWTAVYPRSYGARLAHGIYLRMRAYDARGCQYISDTTQQQISAMEAFLTRATREYKYSVPLTAKPILTYHAILGVAMVHGDLSTATEMLDAACRIDQRNYVVRYKYLATLQTRWGGSLEEMTLFREQARKAGLTPPQLSYFDDMINAERSWLAQQREAH